MDSNDSVCNHKILRYDIGDGYAGREKRYRRCFVCSAYGNRTMSEYYCQQCEVCICTKVNSSGHLCWLDLHLSNDIKEKLGKRVSRLSNASIESKSKETPSKRTPRAKRLRKRKITSDTTNMKQIMTV